MLTHGCAVCLIVVVLIFVPAGKEPEWTNAVVNTLAAEDVKVDQSTSFACSGDHEPVCMCSRWNSSVKQALTSMIGELCLLERGVSQGCFCLGCET